MNDPKSQLFDSIIAQLMTYGHEHGDKNIVVDFLKHAAGIAAQNAAAMAVNQALGQMMAPKGRRR